MCSCSGAGAGVVTLAKLQGEQPGQSHLPGPWAEGQRSQSKAHCTSWLVPLVPAFYCLQESM